MLFCGSGGRQEEEEEEEEGLHGVFKRLRRNGKLPRFALPTWSLAGRGPRIASGSMED
jgi:hypothetical protein